MLRIVAIAKESESRSEVVGRPLAALLANDGARVFSVDIDTIQVKPSYLFLDVGLNH